MYPKLSPKGVPLVPSYQLTFTARGSVNEPVQATLIVESSGHAEQLIRALVHSGHEVSVCEVWETEMSLPEEQQRFGRYGYADRLLRPPEEKFVPKGHIGNPEPPGTQAVISPAVAGGNSRC